MIQNERALKLNRSAEFQKSVKGFLWIVSKYRLLTGFSFVFVLLLLIEFMILIKDDLSTWVESSETEGVFMFIAFSTKAN